MPSDAIAMLITDRFVYVHMPKTGGTFVTEALTKLHRPRTRSVFLRRAIRALGIRTGARRPSRYGPLENVQPKHGTCHDVPALHRDKPILSNVRSPYDWYVSQYEFAWWKRTSAYHAETRPTPVGFAIEQVLPDFQSAHPEFPEVSFEGFLELCQCASRTYGADTTLGLYTHGFLRYFFRDAEGASRRLDSEYVRSGTCANDMFTVAFLRTHVLNEDLHAFLLSTGYRPKDVAFVRHLERILPMGLGRRDDQAWEGYYTPALKALVREREWVLFEMFPEFDV